MSQPEIVRHSGAHQVTMTEGSKNAQSRHGTEKSTAVPDTARIEPQAIHWREHATPVRSPEAQLSHGAADSTDVWHGDDDMSLRMAQLQKRNLSLAQRLQRMTGSGRKEEKNE
jgi:hypothetical protein